MNSSDSSKTCWIVTDGSAGMENQCIGLAEAMNFSPLIKRIQTKKPWRWLPPVFWHAPLHQLKPEGDQLTAPWPDVLITCGRQAIPMSIAIRKASKGQTFTVHIQTPNTSADKFDLVIVPAHDRLRGDNVEVSEGSLTRITPQKLELEYTKFKAELDPIEQPVVTVLVGGSNRCYDVTPDVMKDLCQKLEQLHQETNCFFLVTSSRRTGSANETILKQTLGQLPHKYWQGNGPNPYFAYLWKSDAVIVTADSVNMVCEAVTAAKPALVYELKGGNRKFRHFHRQMQEKGYTKAFSGHLESWPQPVLRESGRLAEIVWARLSAR